MTQKEWYNKRKKEHKCVSCGVKLLPEHHYVRCDKCIEEQHQYDTTHKEEKKVTNRKHRKNNSNYYINYRLQHRNDRREYDIQYRKNNMKRRIFWNNQRRIQKRARGSHTLGEWELLKAQYDWTCPSCNKKEPIIILTEDHIVPLSKGGSNNIENIQPLCMSCNRRKFTKIIVFEKLHSSK